MGLDQNKFEMMKLFADGIVKQFGANCEVVIHDYSKPFESSIVYIANGEVTGRKIGDTGSSIGLSVYAGEKFSNGKYNYISKTKNGKIVRSSTMWINDDDGNMVGSFCINYDMSDMMKATGVINAFINNKSDEAETETKAEIESDNDAPVLGSITDLLSEMIEESIKYIGVPVERMTREEKIIGIHYLSKRGVFSIKNAAQEVANRYCVSKYTIYNYISEKG